MHSVTNLELFVVKIHLYSIRIASILRTTVTRHCYDVEQSEAKCTAISNWNHVMIYQGIVIMLSSGKNWQEIWAVS